MSNIFFISDTHFGHEAPYTKFLREDGTMLRPQGSAAAGDEEMVKNWNAVVRPKDKVYHLGDITMGTATKHLEILGRLNGEKVLIKGNHDLCKLSAYAEYFKDVRGVHQFDGLILTHVPVHPDSLSRWRANVHGHLHHRRVLLKGVVDPRYYCVAVECIKYTPIPYETLKLNIQKEQNV